MRNRQGIDLLRYAVQLLDRCNESVNQRFTAPQLLRIAEATQASEWDMYPDQWTERQLQECVQFGMTPKWEEKEGELVPKYHNESENVVQVAVNWVSTSNVTVYADSTQEAINWAEGDMPLPKDGEYLDDSFNVNEADTNDLNPNDEVG